MNRTIIIKLGTKESDGTKPFFSFFSFLFFRILNHIQNICSAPALCELIGSPGGIGNCT